MLDGEPCALFQSSRPVNLGSSTFPAAHVHNNSRLICDRHKGSLKHKILLYDFPAYAAVFRQ